MLQDGEKGVIIQRDKQTYAVAPHIPCGVVKPDTLRKLADTAEKYGAAALILKGLTPGAALVFLMTGPATNAASFVTIWKTLGSRTAITYILTVAGCAILSGIVLDYIAVGFNFEIATRPGWMLPPVIKYISAVVLLCVLGFAVFGEGKRSV